MRAQNLLNERLAAKYPIPLDSYVRMACRVGIARSVIYSCRHRGRIVVGRRARIRVARSARIDLSSRSILVLGLAHELDLPSSIVVEPGGTLRIDGIVQIMRGTAVTVNWGGMLSIGGGTYLNDGCLVHCAGRMTIGRDCAVAWRCTLTDTDVHVLERRDVPAGPGHLEIGDRCWIGAGTTVLKNTTIGDGAVIAAESLVTRDVPGAALAAGSPAAVVDTQVRWRIR
ncbi:MAG: acyltransferase [Solirubrobacteraceae bacterium]